MAIRLPLLGVLLALGLAACGGSSATADHPPAATTRVVTRTVTTPSTSTQAPATSTASTATTGTSTTPSGPPTCTAATLTPSFLGSNGATGHVVLGFALRNHGEASCHTYGFPGVEFLDHAGQPVPGTVLRQTHDFAGAAPETAITLGPGQSASFRIVNSDVGAGRCPSGAAVQIIPPNDTTPMRVALGSATLVCGHPTVSPLEPGTAAFPGP